MDNENNPKVVDDTNEITDTTNNSQAEGPTRDDSNQGASPKGENATGPTETTAPQDDNRQAANRQDEYLESVQNWRVLRGQKDRAEKERDELQRRLNQSAPQVNNLQANNLQAAEEEVVLADDDLVEAKHLKRERKKSDQRLAKMEGRIIESEINTKFPDFSEVVTAESIEMLKDSEPELYQALAANPDIYSKAVATYKTIKRYGLAKPDYSREKETIDRNLAKPRPLSSVSPSTADSPLSKANAFAQGLSDTRKKQIWEETQAILKGH